MAEIKSYRDLLVWQRGLKLSSDVYKLTSKFPKSETYGLASQMQRCAVSIPSNIAEGHERHGTKEFLQFLSIAKGSAAELETQLLIANKVYGIEVDELVSETIDIRKMIQAIVNKLKSKQ